MQKNKQNHDYDCSHVTMTFAALNTLLTLGDDLSKLNKQSILASLKALQLPDGRCLWNCIFFTLFFIKF